MEHLSACVTDRMITLGIISSDDKKNRQKTFSAQMLLEQVLHGFDERARKYFWGRREQ